MLGTLICALTGSVQVSHNEQLTKLPANNLVDFIVITPKTQVLERAVSSGNLRARLSLNALAISLEKAASPL